MAGDPRPEGAERDLVRFYARLTRGLEEHCGARVLSDFLAGLRRARPESGHGAADVPALSRFFRRVGFLGPGADPASFLPVFLKGAAEAVSRSEMHVLGLVRAQVLGIGESSIRPVCGAVPLCRACGLTRECDHYNSPRRPEMTAVSPAERLLAGAAGAVSDSELLALALAGGKATGREPEVAALFERYGRLGALFGADPHEYAGMRAVGRRHTLRLAAISALHGRLLAEKRDRIAAIACAGDLHDRYAPELRGQTDETLILVMLDDANGVVRDAWFHGGSAAAGRVRLPDLLRPAIREAASGVALVHNHPSGDPAPSMADRDFTRRFRSACDAVGLRFLDHVVVGERGFFSFAEESAMEI